MSCTSFTNHFAAPPFDHDMRLIIAMLLALHAAVHPATELAEQQEVREAFGVLLHEARDGCSHDEMATFIVRLPYGRLVFVRWPPADSADEARWTGAFPRGTVAIAHTHPNWMPRPSRIDVATARRANLPVYVITRGQITRTAGGEVTTVAAGEWTPGAEPGLRYP